MPGAASKEGATHRGQHDDDQDEPELLLKDFTADVVQHALGVGDGLIRVLERGPGRSEPARAGERSRLSRADVPSAGRRRALLALAPELVEGRAGDVLRLGVGAQGVLDQLVAPVREIRTPIRMHRARRAPALGHAHRRHARACDALAGPVRPPLSAPEACSACPPTKRRDPPPRRGGSPPEPPQPPGSPPGRFSGLWQSAGARRVRPEVCG